MGVGGGGGFGRGGFGGGGAGSGLSSPLSMSIPASSAGTGAGMGRGGRGSVLTPALELLRPHVFGFLRVAFSSESTMHTSSAAFSLAVELWLLWMRPWAAPAIARGRFGKAVGRQNFTTKKLIGRFR